MHENGWNFGKHPKHVGYVSKRWYVNKIILSLDDGVEFYMKKLFL